MAITLNPTAKQTVRFQEALANYNASTGQNLTVKQWIYAVLTDAVIAQLSGQTHQAAEAARASAETAIQADMTGTA